MRWIDGKGQARADWQPDFPPRTRWARRRGLAARAAAQGLLPPARRQAGRQRRAERLRPRGLRIDAPAGGRLPRRTAPTRRRWRAARPHAGARDPDPLVPAPHRPLRLRRLPHRHGQIRGPGRDRDLRQRHPRVRPRHRQEQLLHLRRDLRPGGRDRRLRRAQRRRRRIRHRRRPRFPALLRRCRAWPRDSSRRRGMRRVFERAAARSSASCSALTARPGVTSSASSTTTTRPQRIRHPPTPVEQVSLALGALFTLQGIPCVYYGTEQGLDGTKTRTARPTWAMYEPVREALWGKPRPSMAGRRLYQDIQASAALRLEEPALRYGRLYFREVAGNGRDFGLPGGAGGLLAYSRVLAAREVVVVANTSATQRFTGSVVVDGLTHRAAAPLEIAYSNRGTTGGSAAPRRSRMRASSCRASRWGQGPAAALDVTLGPSEVQVFVPKGRGEGILPVGVDGSAAWRARGELLQRRRGRSAMSSGGSPWIGRSPCSRCPGSTRPAPAARPQAGRCRGVLRQGCTSCGCGSSPGPRPPGRTRTPKSLPQPPWIQRAVQHGPRTSFL